MSIARVCKAAVATTTEKVFAIRIARALAERVSVTKGAKDGDWAEVRGELSAGDSVAKRGSDEIRPGQRVGW